MNAQNLMTWPTAEIRRESDLLRMLENILRMRLPRGWRAEVRPSPSIAGRRPDALLEVCAPTGECGVVLVEAKLGLEPREVGPIVRMLKEALIDADLKASEKGPPMIVARFVSQRARDLLREQDACYADATGNVRLVLDRPAIFIEAEGANTNPWREVRDLRSLKGRSASRVVRALCDFKPPLGVRELVKRAGSSTGSTVRTLDFLEREALIERDARKRVVDVRVALLISRWASDFRFTDQNVIRYAFEPRPLKRVISRLANTTQQYAITGSFAATAVAPYAEPRLLVVYAEQADELIEELALRPAADRSNVWVADPPDELPFERTWKQDGVEYAALSQVACDLLDLPGRSPSEGEELLRWMEAKTDAWRAD
jgi:hypothetical protein